MTYLTSMLLYNHVENTYITDMNNGGTSYEQDLDRKQLVLDAMDNKAVERVPAGFWFHFLADEIHSNAFEQPELTEQVLAGEIKYIEESQPDFVKIMTDGFFPYTSESFWQPRPVRI